MAKLLRVDRNGTKYWVETQCPKCGGNGYIDYYAYNQGGVCFNCGGTGEKTTTWKEYTPEYAQKLADRRLAKAKKQAPEKNAKIFKREGFSEDGKAWVVAGDTYLIKDELKEAGARWSGILGWHFDKADNGFTCFEVTADDLMEKSEAGEYYWGDMTGACDYIDELKAKYAPKTDSEYIGNIGDKVELELTFVQHFTFETHYTYSGELNFIYKFADEDNNTVCWKTSKALELNEGQAYKVAGTIKDHKEYKGDKQTVLTRCKVTI